MQLTHLANAIEGLRWLCWNEKQWARETALIHLKDNSIILVCRTLIRLMKQQKTKNPLFSVPSYRFLRKLTRTYQNLQIIVKTNSRIKHQLGIYTRWWALQPTFWKADCKFESEERFIAIISSLKAFTPLMIQNKINWFC